MKLVNREKGAISCSASQTVSHDQEWEPAWQWQGTAESVARLGWQDFIKPQLLQKGKLAVLVLLPAPPKICCLRPNRDMGTRDSWAVRDAANPDLSRWTCERLQLSIGWVEEEKSVLSVLSCCHQGLEEIFTGVWIQLTQLFVLIHPAARRCPRGGAAVRQGLGQKSWLALQSQDCPTPSRFSLAGTQVPTPPLWWKD